jgi:hypothetical protein
MGVFDTPTGTIGAVQSGAGAILGAANQIAAGVHAKKARNQLKVSDAFNENMFNKQYYQDMMDRSEVQSALNLQRKNDAAQAQQDMAQAAVMGATPEVQAAMQQQRNQGMANTIAQIAANASAYKDAILGNYQNAKNNYFNSMANSYMQQSANETKASEAGWNMASNGLSTMAKGIV